MSDDQTQQQAATDNTNADAQTSQQTQNQDQQQQTQQTANDQGDRNISWLDGLPEDLKGNEAIKTFKSPDDLAKAYLAASKPKDGVPASPDAYTVTLEGVPSDDPLLKGFLAVAHKHGLNDTAAKEIAGLYGQQFKAVMDAREKAYQAAVTELQADWGNDYQANLDAANTAAEKMGGPALLAALKEAGLDNHPEVVRHFHRIGRAIAESKFHLGDAPLPTMETTPGGNPMFSFKDMPARA